MKRLLVLLIVTGLVLISGCTQQGPTEEKKTQNERNLEENSQLYTALKLVGLETLVDSTDERILIRFELPPFYSKELSVVVALSAATVAKSDQIIVQIYKSDKKTDEIKTTKQAVLDSINGKTQMEDFLDNLDWQTFDE